MLRASAAATHQPLDARALLDAEIDPLVAGGGVLIRFVTALLQAGDVEQEVARAAVEAELGPAGLVDAAGVFGNFEMMNRIADATGMPVPRHRMATTGDWQEEIGIDRMAPA